MKSTFCYFICTLLMCGNYITTQAQTYDAHDKAALRNFLIQESAEAGLKNYEQVNLTTTDIENWDTSEDWVSKLAGSVSWNKETPKRLTYISWIFRSLAGTLDLSGCDALQSLEIMENKLTSINLDGCKVIKSLSCQDNILSNLNLKGCESLNNLSCNNNRLTVLNVTDSPLLKDLRCYSNSLTSLQMPELPALTYLDCKNNKLTSLDLKGFTALDRLLCQLNSITSLDVSGLTNLKSVDSYNNQLTSLDASGCTALTRIYCQSNLLETLNTEGCAVLNWLDCESNELVSVDVSSSPILRTLYCGGNQLPQIDVSECPKLEFFNCTTNKLSALDVSKNTLLKSFRCNFNQISNLDVSQNTALQTFHCNNNALSALDVTKCPSLTELNAAYQTITKEGVLAIDDTITIDNTIFLNGKRVETLGGEYTTYVSPLITWADLKPEDTMVSYTFSTARLAGISGTPFGGTVYQPFEKTVGINENQVGEESTVTTNGSDIIIDITQGQVVSIYSLAGKLIKEANLNSGKNSIQVATGIYIVKLSGGTTAKCNVSRK